MNDIVCRGLEIIFGIWLLNFFSSMFLGIDFIETIQKFVDKMLNERKSNEND